MDNMVVCDQNVLAKRIREDDLPEFPTPSARHVFGAMATFACRNTYCWPSKATLASVTGLSVRTVDSAIKALKAAGFVRIVSRGGSFRGERKANRYDLFLPTSNAGEHPRNDEQAPPQPATATPATIAGHPRNQRQPPPQPLRGTPATSDSHPRNHCGVIQKRSQKEIRILTPTPGGRLILFIWHSKHSWTRGGMSWASV